MKTEVELRSVPEADSNEMDWIVVSQVKSYRVVYFTDDTDYVPPSEGDWYYISPYRGALPKGMTLRNCWRWRFNGSEFVDAGVAKSKQGVDFLLQRNKEALRKLLREKIDALRQPYAPKSLMGERVREAKLVEARRYLGLNENGVQPVFLVDAAASHKCTVREIAQRVVDLHEAEMQMLRHTEQLRESFSVAIDDARTQDELVHLRSRLMDEVAPELNALFAIKPPHTTPKKMGANPPPEELAVEQLRLRTQLREQVNALRRPYVSQYLLDDLVLKHRGRIAQSVLAAGGALPPGIEGGSLISFAAARRQPLLAAAKEVLSEMDDAARVLLETEQMKDAMLSAIAAVSTFEDIRRTAAAVSTLSLSGARP